MSRRWPGIRLGIALDHGQPDIASGFGKVRETLMLEKPIEKAIFLSRWMMVPFYLGLLVSLTVLIATFLKEL